MKSFGFLAVVVLTMTGCQASHKPGPVLALYQNVGGPNYIRGNGQYDSSAIENFFKNNPQIKSEFIREGGVCSLRHDPFPDEITQEKLICTLAIYSRPKQTSSQ